MSRAEALAPDRTARFRDLQPLCSHCRYMTGDIGEQLPNGGVAVVDRVSNLFKLAQVQALHPSFSPSSVLTPFSSFPCVPTSDSAGSQTR
eukprot:SAG11_NODE_6786_length_1249_cov_1.055652_3_plen_89_part_01